MMTQTASTASPSLNKTPAARTEPTKAKGHARALKTHVDIYENEREFLVIADVPGATKESLTIQFDRGELSFEASVDLSKFAEGPAQVCGYSYQRAFAIPDTVDSAKIDAELDAGVLRLRLPKVETAKPMQIPVRGR